jgi:hypothetical protein
VLESIESAGDSDGVRCPGGERACPPDDDDFDPEFFDIEQVNEALRHLVRSGRKRSRR